MPDDAIEDAAEAVAATGARFVGHTSGATGLAALGSVTAAGSGAFSLHPLMTVPDGETDLTGAPAAIAGSGEDALALARDVALRLGMRPFEVAEESRAAYHAAASMASNFLIALEESAVELLGKAGIPDGRELLAPLVLRSAANWSDRGGAALTGPISRGDEATVARHVAALEAVDPELLDLYRALAERTASIAAGRREAEDASAGVAR